MKHPIIKSVVAMAAALPLLLGAWTPPKEAVVHQRPVSKSLWIWTGDKPVSNGAIACFRTSFDLTGDATKAVVRVNYDDGGKLWINGKNIGGKRVHSGTSEYNILKFLKPGKNTVAIEVHNGASSAGVLFYGEINLRGGKNIYLHSTVDTKSISGPRKDKWQEVNYDDSAWGKSHVFGDILIWPWSKYRDLTKDFFSPEEARRFNAAEKKSQQLPAGLAKEKFQPASIIYEDGMPWVKVGAQRLWPVFDLTLGGNLYDDSWIYRHGQLGVRIFQIGQDETNILRPDGSLNFERTDKAARRVLNLVPDAKIGIVLRLGSMREWCKQNPDEIMRFSNGPSDSRDELNGRTFCPSPASKKFRKEMVRYLEALAKFVHKQPWAKRVIGLRVSHGIYSEWHSFGMYQAPDVSKHTTEAFREYLKKKYKTVQALRKAWNDNNVTFENAQVPTHTERWEKPGFFRNPKTDMKVLDFYDCYAHIHADLMLFMAKKAKELFPGRLCGAYYGYVLCNHPPEGSTVLLDKVLSSPYIDYLSSPPDYNPDTRRAGGHYLSRSVAATFARYGKLLLIEDDSRFFHNLEYNTKSWSSHSEHESRMNMRRNMLNPLFEVSGTQFCDPSTSRGGRPGAFDAPEVDQGLKESLEVMEKVLPLPDDSGNEIAVVWEYMERLRHSNTPPKQSKTNLGNFVNGMALLKLYRSGYTFDLMSMSDFMVMKKKYKVVIFLNAFTLNTEQRNAIKAKVRQPGVTAIFFNGAGFVTPEGFSAEAISDLTGIRVTVDKDGRNSRLNLQSGTSSTSGRGIDERFIVADTKVDAFGVYEKDKKVGAAEKKLLGNSRSIYMGLYPVTTAQWREILGRTGVKPLTKSGSYIRRRGNLVMFHTGTKGTHRITFPGNVKGATEMFSGKKTTGNTVTVTSTEGADTWLFQTY